MSTDVGMPEPAPGRIRDDILTAQLQGEAVLLDLQTKRYYRLNATGARIWKGLQDLLQPHEIVDALLQEFAVDRATAQAETERTLDDLRAHGLIT